MPIGTDTITKEILSRRRYGRSTCVIDQHQVRSKLDDEGLTVEIDSFIGKLGFVGLGKDWAHISTSDAKVIAKTILENDLAYKAPIMSETESSKLIDCFFSFFAEDVRCYTNGNLILPFANPRWVPGAFSGLSQSTFDSGIVCVDSDRIGILWVEDED